MAILCQVLKPMNCKRSIAAKPHEVRSKTLGFVPKISNAHLRREVFP